jgi:hypothetical protein
MKWSQLHCYSEDKDDTDVVNTMCDIKVNDYVYYECHGTVELCNGIPAQAEVTRMTRQVVDYDNDGDVVDEITLDYSEFPEYIMRAAERKLVEEW